MTDTQAPERICVEFEDSGPDEKGAWLWVSKDDLTQIKGDYFHDDYVRSDVHNAVVAERDQLKDTCRKQDVALIEWEQKWIETVGFTEARHEPAQVRVNRVLLKSAINKISDGYWTDAMIDEVAAALEPDTVASDQARAEWKKIAMALFAALDDIDTADDIAKDNEKLYRNLVRKAHKVRFEFQELFDPDGDVSSFNQPPL